MPAYRHLVDPNAAPDAEDPKVRLPSTLVTTDDVTPEQHVAMQVAAQKWVDSSIPKTVNVSTDIPVERFKELYLLAHEKGPKGCTAFRFNPAAFQGVLDHRRPFDQKRLGKEVVSTRPVMAREYWAPQLLC